MNRATITVALAIAFAACSRPETVPHAESPPPAARFAASAAHCHTVGELPDGTCTPGAVETTDMQIICGQSTRERRSVPESVRHERFASYGVPWENRGDYELDHLVALEVGGSNDATNLWPEPLSEAHVKDKLENALHREVCAGTMTPAEAQRIFETDWTKGSRDTAAR